jgi:hypothetical protein
MVRFPLPMTTPTKLSEKISLMLESSTTGGGWTSHGGCWNVDIAYTPSGNRHELLALAAFESIFADNVRLQRRELYN